MLPGLEPMVAALPPRPLPAQDAPRYTRTAVVLHWLIGVALLAEIAFGFLLDDIAPRGTPARAVTINLHPPPPFPSSMPAPKRFAARSMHLTLYACMIAVPLTGYIGSNFSRHGVKFFGLLLPPWGPDLPQVYALLNTLHDASSWLFCALLAIHVLAALKHALVDRDGVFARMTI